MDSLNRIITIGITMVNVTPTSWDIDRKPLIATIYPRNFWVQQVQHCWNLQQLEDLVALITWKVFSNFSGAFRCWVKVGRNRFVGQSKSSVKPRIIQTWRTPKVGDDESMDSPRSKLFFSRQRYDKFYKWPNIAGCGSGMKDLSHFSLTIPDILWIQ